MKQVAEWRADVVKWAEENVRVQSPATGIVGPLRLADHQKAFLREARGAVALSPGSPGG